MSDIERKIYMRKDNSWGGKVNLGNCRYRCFGDWHPYQCSRKPKYSVGGFGFCAQHTKMMTVEFNIEALDYVGKSK